MRRRRTSQSRLCKVLDVSPSGYFAWKDRPASARQREDLVLLAHVRSAFMLSHETYGSPRMTHELREQGLAAGRRRVARLMRENGLKARQPRRFRRTTDSGHAFPVAPNHLRVEYEPRYIDLIIARYEEVTGKRAVREAEGSQASPADSDASRTVSE